MTKNFDLLLVASVALTAGVANAKSKHVKKTHVAPAARAAAPAYRGADKFPVGPLYYSGVYMGDDPDPFIRSQIWRDVSGRFGGDF
jgi:hypothetical protein